MTASASITRRPGRAPRSCLSTNSPTITAASSRRFAISRGAIAALPTMPEATRLPMCRKTRRSYSQERARDDIRAVLDGLASTRARRRHYRWAALRPYISASRIPSARLSLVVAGCGYGAEPGKRQLFLDETAKTAALIESAGMKVAAETYASGPSRVQFQNKDPRGWVRICCPSWPSIRRWDRRTRCAACRRGGLRFGI